MRLIILFIVLVLTTNCSVNEVHRISGGIDLNLMQADNTFPLRSDGLYNLKQTKFGHDGDKYIIYCPLIFLSNRKAIWSNDGGAYNYDELRLSYYLRYPHFTDNVGDYITRNDTIWAKTPITLIGRGGSQQTYESYFQGEIKNRDTIVNWHMIPPYPKANRNWNDNFESLTKPNQLHFIESKELLGLDSLYRQRLKEQKIKK